VPAKKILSAPKTVDLQRGEAESDSGNLYFNQWDYDFAWQMLPAKQPASELNSNS